MSALTPHLEPRLIRPAAIVGIAAILGLIALMSRWVGTDGQAVTFEAFESLLISLPRPLAWLAAAIGLGWPLRRWLAGDSSHPVALQVALGIAAMLMLDAALGAVGLLSQSVVAWGIIALGIAVLIVQIARHGQITLDRCLPDAIGWTCAPGVAVLLIAACSAPGWLWSSEFGGYDALSYHLQLPKEWLAVGRMQPLEHNVYSFLPGYVEAAYLHIMALHGRHGAMNALIDCQLLHALLTIVAAAMTGTLASRLAGRVAGAIAAALYLATPWTIVVGSLAYNEMAVNLMLAAGLLVVFNDGPSAARRGLLIGILSAAATGAKLTSLGFVAAPLGLALLLQVAPRRWFAAIACAAAAGAIGLLPYLLRNWAHAGNPLFPFATEIFGVAHWSAEQAQAWHRGHMPDATIAQRLASLWRQFFTYGMGANPNPGEPWQLQWSLLPLLGIAGAIAGVLSSTARRASVTLSIVVLAQLAFWLAFTHLQSRFLLPALVPLCAIVAMALAPVLQSRADHTAAPHRLTLLLAALALLALSVLPMRLYYDEHAELGHAPALAIGSASQQSGEALDEASRREIGSTSAPAISVNWLLPPDSKVLLVGEAAPLYYRLDRITYNTVWDRGALSPIMREHGSDPEAMREALRALGFTHVLVNPTMLTIWERDQWNDPQITQRSVLEFLESAGEPLFDYPRPSEITIYALPP